jgi:O-antigen/teichoic acid export membrane protein
VTATAQAEETSARRTLVRSGVVIAVAVGAANVLNAVFQFSLARILDPGDYALLAALFAVVLVGAIPPLAFQATAAREVSSRLSRGDAGSAATVLRGMLRSVLVWSAVLLVAAAVFVPLAAAAGVEDPLAFGATGATVAVALAIPVLWGGLQGEGRFYVLAGAHVCFAATRLLAGLVIGLAGGGVGAVMLGLAGATAVTAAFSALPLRSLLRLGEPIGRTALGTRANAGAAIALTALWALIYSDLLVARIVFDGDEAGAYAAASVGARVLLLLGIAATTVLFPRVASLADPTRERRYLLAGLGAVGVLSAVGVLFLWVFAGSLVELAFGKEYAAADAWLGPLSLAMALYGLTIVYLYHFLALGRARFGIVLAALLGAQLVAYALFHDTPRQLIGVQLVFAAAAVVAGELWYLARGAEAR